MSDQIAYFTLTDRAHRDSIIVCIAKFHGKPVSFGVAMKSTTDVWKTGRGKKLALERAKAAGFMDSYYFDERNFITRREANEVMHNLNFNDFCRLNQLLDSGSAHYRCKSDNIRLVSFDEVVHMFSAPAPEPKRIIVKEHKMEPRDVIGCPRIQVIGPCGPVTE